MKMYTEASNAKRAAKTVADKNSELIQAAPSVRWDGAQPMYYPAVSWVAHPNSTEPKGDAEKALHEQLADTVKFRTVEEEAPEAPAPKAKKPAAKKAAKKTAGPAHKAKAGTKTDMVLKLMGRKNGATTEEIMEAANWQPHSVRGFVSNENRLRNRGIRTERKDGVTRYIIG